MKVNINMNWKSNFLFSVFRVSVTFYIPSYKHLKFFNIPATCGVTQTHHFYSGKFLFIFFLMTIKGVGKWDPDSIFLLLCRKICSHIVISHLFNSWLLFSVYCVIVFLIALWPDLIWGKFKGSSGCPLLPLPPGSLTVTFISTIHQSSTLSISRTSYPLEPYILL